MVLNFIVMPNVDATSECGYVFHLMFCHAANKNRYAQIISGYLPDSKIKLKILVNITYINNNFITNVTL